ncbi:unnamed protein product [Prunus armeniaca]|uniref:Putative plant transposon protein domain-containing protein n=1 Tax=Prunus armeniaca TaxID=36596 RepID=A0A6J5UGQ9_PRUAR|nr:unnamed protein product [Prunus armeniaca]
MSSSEPLHTYHRRSKSKSTDRVDFNPSIPRVPRTRSSSSVPVGDSSPFVSNEAASFFNEVVSKRKFIPERTYQFDAVPLAAQESANQILEHYHLQALNSLSSKFNIPVVQEFYSNFPADPKESKYQILVRSVPITLKPSVINRVLGLPIKSYLSPFYKFLWDFIRHNVLPTGNNSNPTLAACQLMISMVNHDKIPLGDILYNAILGKTIGHVASPHGPYGKASAALSQRVSRTFLTSVSSSSENASLRAQLAAKEEYIQHLLTLIPSTSIPAPAAAAATADPQPASATDEDSDDSVDSGGSLIF